MKNHTKSLLSFIVLLMVFVPFVTFAQDPFGTGYFSGIAGSLPTTDIREVAINLINILLSLLGTVFMLLVFYGGFLWMTAGGNDDQASKGRKVIGNAIVGLLVIFVAFAITTFVFNILSAVS